MIEGGYPNSSGHSGSETSEARAKREDSTGITGERQRQVYDYVVDQRIAGTTCAEVEKILGLGHGAASGALTRLHRAGRIVRLSDTREGQQVYIHPLYVDGDASLSPYRPNAGPQYSDREILEKARDIADRLRLAATVSFIGYAIKQLEREERQDESTTAAR